MHYYFFRGHYMFREANSFPSVTRGILTVIFEEQINFKDEYHIRLKPNVFIVLQIFLQKAGH